MLILIFDLGVLPCQAMPYPRKPSWQSPSALLAFSLPTLFVGFVGLSAFFLMPRNHLGLAKVQHGKALPRACFRLFDEFMDLACHGLRNRRFDLLGGMEGLHDLQDALRVLWS